MKKQLIAIVLLLGITAGVRGDATKEEIEKFKKQSNDLRERFRGQYKQFARIFHEFGKSIKHAQAFSKKMGQEARVAGIKGEPKELMVQGAKLIKMAGTRLGNSVNGPALDCFGSVVDDCRSIARSKWVDAFSLLVKGMEVYFEGVKKGAEMLKDAAQ